MRERQERGASRRNLLLFSSLQDVFYQTFLHHLSGVICIHILSSFSSKPTPIFRLYRPGCATSEACKYLYTQAGWHIEGGPVVSEGMAPYNPCGAKSISNELYRLVVAFPNFVEIQIDIDLCVLHLISLSISIYLSIYPSCWLLHCVRICSYSPLSLSVFLYIFISLSPLICI